MLDGLVLWCFSFVQAGECAMRLSTVLGGVLALLVALVFVTWLAGSGRTPAVADPAAQGAGPPQPNEHGYYFSNPFTPATGPPFPKAEVPETRYEFGRLSVGKAESHTFIVKNVGEAPLKVALGLPTCKCTMGKLGTEELAPGESTEVTMDFKPETTSENFAQSATIYTNDPEMPVIALSIQGEVLPLLISIPEAFWTIGVIREDGPTTFTGRILSPLYKDFQIVAITPGSDYLRVIAEPLEPQELGAMSVGGYELKCEVEPRMPIGPFHDIVTVETDIPDAAPLKFTVSGNRMGPFHIMADEWFPTKSLLRMGRFNAADGKRAAMSVFVSAREQPLELVRDTSEPDILRVSLV
jgi:hypothetical protein